MPGVSRGLLVNLWPVAPRESSCDPHGGKSGEGRSTSHFGATTSPKQAHKFTVLHASGFG